MSAFVGDRPERALAAIRDRVLLAEVEALELKAMTALWRLRLLRAHVRTIHDAAGQEQSP